MRVVLLLLGSLIALPANAGVPIPAEFQPVLDALLHNTAVTFMCKEKVGESYFVLARMMAVSSIGAYFHDRDRAIVEMDKAEKEYAANWAAADQAYKVQVTVPVCIKVIGDAMHAVEVEKAKFNLRDK